MAESKANVRSLYDHRVKPFLKDVQFDDFYNFFIQCIKSGNFNAILYQNYIERHIDLDWVTAIEKCIVPIDSIIRNPIKNIVNEEDIVPIEQARKITSESIRHLAQHTNMISSVIGDEVTPNRILNIRKEETIDVYENRFVYTLISRLQYFLDKRLGTLLNYKDVADKFELSFKGSSKVGADRLKFDICIAYETPHTDINRERTIITADVKQMTSLQRIERIKKILTDFQGSAFFKNLHGCAMIKPPLRITNVLGKNRNFRACVDLWRFIETYDKKGFSIEKIDQSIIPDENYLNELISTLAIDYSVVKANNIYEKSLYEEEQIDYKKLIQEQQLSPVQKNTRSKIEEIMETYNLGISETKKVFLDQLKRVENKQKIEQARINNLIDRICADQQNVIAQNYIDIVDIEIEAKRRAEEKAKQQKEALEQSNQLSQLKEKLAALDSKNQEPVVEEVKETVAENATNETQEVVEETPVESVNETTSEESTSNIESTTSNPSTPTTKEEETVIPLTVTPEPMVEATETNPVASPVVDEQKEEVSDQQVEQPVENKEEDKPVVEETQPAEEVKEEPVQEVQPEPEKEPEVETKVEEVKEAQPSEQPTEETQEVKEEQEEKPILSGYEAMLKKIQSFSRKK